MTAPGGPGGPGAPPPSAPERPSVPQQVGIGCLTAVAGLFSGGMIAVLVAKIVGSARGCQPAAGTPACDWDVYLRVGMLAGLISLPIITLWKLRRSHGAAARNPERGGARGTD